MNITDQNLSRRRFLQYSGLAAAGGVASAWPGSRLAQPAADASRPNVLVLLTDDQTYNTIAALGNEHIQTPNLDRLASEGTTLSHCFNQGSWDGAICVASRAMINSGRNMYRITEPRNDRQSKNLNTDYPLWGEHFRDRGYDTFSTGKWHNGVDAFVRSFSHGDAVHIDGMHRYSEKRGGSGKITLGHAHPSLYRYDGTNGKLDPYDAGETWSSDAFGDAATQFLDSRRGVADPFFGVVSFSAPHDPRHAPQQYLDLYDPRSIKLPPNFVPEHSFDFGVRGIRDERLLPYPRTSKAVKREIAIYYAMITHLDARIGDILDKLTDIGQLENTVIVFTSDHGLAIGEHGLLGKQNQYEHSIRVPMIWRGPGIAPGVVRDDLVYLHQLYGTTCELTGLPLPEHLSLPSLGPVIRGEQPGLPSIFGGYKDEQRMVRTDRYKLIRYPGVDEIQLFDLEKDPWEKRDLAERRGHRAKVKELDEMLREWQPIVGDSLELTPLRG